MWFKLNGRYVADSQGANTLQAVMQTRRIAGIEVHSPTVAKVAKREMGHADFKHI